MKYITLFVLLGFLWMNAIAQTKTPKHRFYLGADLSYVNELEDCGGKWKVDGLEKDPYQIFADKECSVVRVRIWHNPQWTRYSTLPDVVKTIQRSKAEKMRILLDFHYSDNWTDPAHQSIPKAWEKITNVAQLGDSVYAYTYNTLMKLDELGLLPELVQVGNETNAEILQYQATTSKAAINWKRNASLLNRGLDGVRAASRKAGKPIETMLHIAQPDEAYGWYASAVKNKLRKFDWIGLSYYPQWSKFDLVKLQDEVKRLKTRYRKRVMVVEAGYPFTLANIDSANNLFDTTSYRAGYPITKLGQRQFMINLTKAVVQGGGEGVIYWEPAWISTSCKTQWGTGTHYDNAIFFDPANGNEALPVFDYFKENQY